jgi:ApaG protein
MPLSHESTALPGLNARLDKLHYHHGGASLPADKPHAFVYFITIRNGSDRTVTLLGRKWVIEHADGSRLVVEGDKIVGETPRLAPGEQFSYNSYHVTGCDAKACGSFHGVDDLGRKVHVLLPVFELIVPKDAS